MNKMELIVGGRKVGMNQLGEPVDRAFLTLHAAYFGNQVLDRKEFDQSAITFFDSNAGYSDAHDKYFNNFTVIWQSLLAAGNFDEAERIWDLALGPALDWEKLNPEQYIHKGTAYYFWGMTALLRGHLDKGYCLVHQGVDEDIRTSPSNYRNLPGFALVSLNYEKPDQAFRPWVRAQADMLHHRVIQYSETHKRQFTLNDLRKSEERVRRPAGDEYSIRLGLGSGCCHESQERWQVEVQ